MFERMIDCAREIAAHMGSDWTAQEYRPFGVAQLSDDRVENWDTCGAYLFRKSDSFRVEMFSWSMRAGGQTIGQKVNVSLWTPRERNACCGRTFRDISPAYRDRTEYGTGSPSAQMSMKKTPKVLAKEILRRMVEPHTGDVQSMWEYLNAEKCREQEALDIVERLKAAGIELKDHYHNKDTATGYIGPLDIEVSKRYASIRVTGHCNNFTEEQALAVAELFKARGWTKRGFEQ